MAKRTYHLTIEYDKESEEIEYIAESIDEVTEQEIISLVIDMSGLAAEGSDQTVEESLKILSRFYIIGRA